MAERIGQQIKRSNNFLFRRAIVVTVVATQWLEGNADRVAYRIIADPENADQVIHGYNDRLTAETTFNYIPPGRTYADEGKETCYKGPVYLLGNIADQDVVIEEVVSKRRG